MFRYTGRRAVSPIVLASPDDARSAERTAEMNKKTNVNAFIFILFFYRLFVCELFFFFYDASLIPIAYAYLFVPRIPVIIIIARRLSGY